MKFKLQLAYDGTGYIGWQENGMGPSIEGELTQVLEKLCKGSFVLEAASRTDAGVHATGQVVSLACGSLRCSQERLQISLNQLLPAPIRVVAVEEVEEHFHPSLDAVGKEYHYSLTLGPFQLPHERFTAWHCRAPLDLNAMERAAKQLIGERDFAPFCNEGHSHKTTVRHLKRIDLIPVGSIGLRIELEADRFLFRMARNLVGTLVWIGRGRLAIEGVVSAKARPETGPTAPAHGLTLVQVDYRTRRCFAGQKTISEEESLSFSRAEKSLLASENVSQ